MTHLLDVNLLIALCDQHHSHHEAAHRWFGKKPGSAWASCPITENAFIRITSNPTYPNWQGSSFLQIQLLRKFCLLPNHTFWPDDISLLQMDSWTKPDLLTSTHLTDIYLLVLAIKNKGKIASFDRNIPVHLVRGGKEALVILPG